MTSAASGGTLAAAAPGWAAGGLALPRVHALSLPCAPGASRRSASARPHHVLLPRVCAWLVTGCGVKRSQRINLASAGCGTNTWPWWTHAVARRDQLARAEGR